jgi:biotin---protein ligase
VKEVLVYIDAGVDAGSARQTVKSLRREVGSRYSVQSVDRHALLKENWEERAALLVIPGGRSLPYEEALGEEGRERIYRYVERGGSYFGICAGAYFGCSRIDFERGQQLEITGVRHIPFYPGVGEGPALGLGRFCYKTNAGAEVAEVRWESDGRCHSISSIYYNGGPTFVGGERSVEVEVLARYAKVEKPAIVQCRVGSGVALLCGVHPEYSTDFLDRRDPHLNRFWPQLEQAEEGRRKLFCELIARLVCP